MTADAEAEQTHISDEMRGLAGREISTRVSYPVAESDIRRWAFAVYYPEDPPAEFVDPEVAAKTRHGGICLLYTSPSPRDGLLSRMPSSA